MTTVMLLMIHILLPLLFWVLRRFELLQHLIKLAGIGISDFG
jgi:hypothetical protein